jgi:DNA-binding NtrC family response regulator
VASILIVGPGTALLEGVTQTLVGAGHDVMAAADINEALDTLGGARPLVAVVDRTEILRSGVSFRAALAHGGAVIAYNSDETEEGRLPFELKRAVLAELRLPLERQRLLALIRSVEIRAFAAGREVGDSQAERPGA